MRRDGTVDFSGGLQTSVPADRVSENASPDAVNVAAGRRSLRVRPGRELHCGVPHGETEEPRVLAAYIPPATARIPYPRLVGVIGSNVYATCGPHQRFEGEDALPIASISRDGAGTATVTLGGDGPWPVAEGCTVHITGVSPEDYNGWFRVKSASNFTFTYELAGGPDSGSGDSMGAAVEYTKMDFTGLVSLSSTNPIRFAQFNNILYVVDGAAPVTKLFTDDSRDDLVEQIETIPIAAAPVFDYISKWNMGPQTPLEPGEYKFFCVFYDPVEDAYGTPSEVTSVFVPNPTEANSIWLHMVLNEDSGAEVGWHQLLYCMPPDTGVYYLATGDGDEGLIDSVDPPRFHLSGTNTQDIVLTSDDITALSEKPTWVDPASRVPPGCHTIVAWDDKLRLVYAGPSPSGTGPKDCIWISNVSDGDLVPVIPMANAPLDYGEVRQIGTDGKNITALEVVGSQLVVCKERGIYLVSGQGSGDYVTMSVIGRYSGPLSQEGVENCAGTLVWQADDGIYSFNGQSVENISDDLQGLWDGYGVFTAPSRAVKETAKLIYHPAMPSYPKGALVVLYSGFNPVVLTGSGNDVEDEPPGSEPEFELELPQKIDLQVSGDFRIVYSFHIPEENNSATFFAPDGRGYELYGNKGGSGPDETCQVWVNLPIGGRMMLEEYVSLANGLGEWHSVEYLVTNLYVDRNESGDPCFKAGKDTTVQATLDSGVHTVTYYWRTGTVDPPADETLEEVGAAVTFGGKNYQYFEDNAGYCIQNVQWNAGDIALDYSYSVDGMVVAITDESSGLDYTTSLQLDPDGGEIENESGSPPYSWQVRYNETGRYRPEMWAVGVPAVGTPDLEYLNLETPQKFGWSEEGGVITPKREGQEDYQQVGIEVFINSYAEEIYT